MTATPELEIALPRRRRRFVQHPVASVLVGAMLFGTAGVAQGFAAVDASPVAVGAMRLAAGALVVTAFVMSRGVTLRHVVGMWRAKATLVAAAGAAAYQPFFFGGIGLAGVPLGTLVAVGSAPVATGLIAWLVLRERPTRHWAIATLVCVAGLALLTGAGTGRSALLGMLLALGAGVSIATFSVAAKRMLLRGVSTPEVLASTFLLGSCVMLPVAVALGIGWVATAPGLALTVWLGVATMGLANVLYTRGLGGLPAPTAATLTLTDPLTATLLGWLLLGQALAPLGWAGLAVLFAGLVLQGVWASRRPRPAHVTPDPALPPSPIA